MNVEYLIQLLENKMIVLTNSKAQSYMIGDLAAINAIDTEMAGVNDTLYKLRLLLAASTEVGSLNSSLVESMKLAPGIVTDGSTEVMLQYDITSYATDPLHEQKIADILSAMGPMITAEAIDAYIDSEAISSPVTGQMVLNAAQTYNVDVRLMLAIMELDSRYGTAGIAVTTFNPGNVGNTGSSTRTYPSWEAGVSAVAEWLNRHRIAEAPLPIPSEPPPEDVPIDVPVEVEEAPAPEPPPVPPPLPPVEEATSTPPVIEPVVELPPVDTGAATSTEATSTPTT
jgi:hypothetical protein